MLYEVITAFLSVIHPCKPRCVTMPVCSLPRCCGILTAYSPVRSMPNLQHGQEALWCTGKIEMGVGVITSYSIHYTKLYDPATWQMRMCFYFPANTTFGGWCWSKLWLPVFPYWLRIRPVPVWIWFRRDSMDG